MSKTPPDAPKVQLEFETPYSKGTQQVSVQTNRLDPREQFAWKWLNWLYPPASPTDFALDAATYIIAASLTASISSQLSWLFQTPVVMTLLLASAITLVTLCWLVIVEVKRAWLLLLYRFTLLLVGYVIGGVL